MSKVALAMPPIFFAVQEAVRRRVFDRIEASGLRQGAQSAVCRLSIGLAGLPTCCTPGQTRKPAQTHIEGAREHLAHPITLTIYESRNFMALTLR